MFSKHAKLLLNEHNYFVTKKDKIISFKKAAINPSFTIGFGIIFLVLTVFIATFTIKVGGILFLIVSLIMLLLLRTSSSTYLEINLIQNSITFLGNHTQKKSLEDVSHISISSELVAEYTSAFKETSEEHRISILVKMADGMVKPLFHFKSDYPEASATIMEIYETIKGWFKVKPQLEVS